MVCSFISHIHLHFPGRATSLNLLNSSLYRQNLCLAGGGLFRSLDITHSSIGRKSVKHVNWHHLCIKNNLPFELTPEQTKHYARFAGYCTIFQKFWILRVILCGEVLIAENQKIWEKNRKPAYLKLAFYFCVGSLKCF